MTHTAAHRESYPSPPPLPVLTSPLIQLEKSLTRKVARLVSSSGSPNRPTGIACMPILRNLAARERGGGGGGLNEATTGARTRANRWTEMCRDPSAGGRHVATMVFRDRACHLTNTVTRSFSNPPPVDSTWYARGMLLHLWLE